MSEEPHGLLLLGAKFPKMEVVTTEGKMTLHDDKEGKWFMLFSHPGDFTPVCTTEFYGFAKRQQEFADLNCDLIGLSIDQVFAHIKWAEWIEENLDQEIGFPIIAEHGEVAKKLGMIHPGKGSNTVRAVFLVDPKGIIRLILYYPQEIGRDVDEILRSLKALQMNTEHGFAAPHKWPNNELIGDKVIVEPAKTRAKAKENSEKYDCYDWWLCYRDNPE